MDSFKELASSIPDDNHQKKNNSSFSGDWDRSDSMALAHDVISKGGLSVIGEKEQAGDYYFKLKYCVFDSSHKNNDAAIIVRSDGSLCYHCFHASCEGRTWSDVRDMIAPKEVRQTTKFQRKAKKVDAHAGVWSLLEGISNFYDTGLSKGFLTGWTSLDNYYTVLPGQWTLVTGIPSHGKSSWLDALMVNLANEHGWTFAVFSPENHPVELHGSKLVEMITGQPFFGSANWPRMTRTEMLAGAKMVDKIFSFISHDEDILTLDGILDRAQKLIDDKGINGLVIDPWNEIDHSLGSDTETLYISKALTKIRLFARNNNIHVWVVAHPTKMQKNESGTYNPPTPYDVAGGAHWRNKADCSITVHRPTFDPGDFRVDIHVQKVRFKHVGKVGKVTLEYRLECGQYRETY